MNLPAFGLATVCRQVCVMHCTGNKERDWVKYESGLIGRKRKIAEFLIQKPSKAQLEAELNEMNEGKRGRRFEIPNSILILFHFMKCIFHIDDRLLVIIMSKCMEGIMCYEREFDHSTIVKRREGLELNVPHGIRREDIAGKVLYFDGTCLRMGRGGYYRSKRYRTEVRYLKIGVFTDNEGKTLDFVIGDEHDAEVNMIREKMPGIKESGAKAFVIDGAGSAADVVVGLAKAGIRPVIRASVSVVESKKNAPPPESCIRQKKDDELIWEKYVKEQMDHEKWKKESGYTSRWVFSEGRFSAFKRMFGEEVSGRRQKTIHDEICAKFMMLDGRIAPLWG